MNCYPFCYLITNNRSPPPPPPIFENIGLRDQFCGVWGGWGLLPDYFRHGLSENQVVSPKCLLGVCFGARNGHLNNYKGAHRSRPTILYARTWVCIYIGREQLLVWDAIFANYRHYNHDNYDIPGCLIILQKSNFYHLKTLVILTGVFPLVKWMVKF